MTESRTNILSRLRQAPPAPPSPPGDWAPPAYGDGRLDRFRTVLESVHAEVHMMAESEWPAFVAALLIGKGVQTLMAAPAPAARLGGNAFRIVPYDRPVEELKEVLVHGAEAALTSAAAGIAETGSLVLWPNAGEPRLMSLLPPIHVALVFEDTIADSLAEIMARDGWAARMPTNLLLVSGPSKTADIEQTLAYGVHGPKELIVLVLTRD